MARDRLSCEACGTKNDVMKLCMGCRSVYYCSRDCQRMAWHNHKVTCGADSTRTSGSPGNTAQSPACIPAEQPASPQRSESSTTPHSGFRVLPDGGYQRYSDGKLVNANGVDVQQVRQRPETAGETKVVTCSTCAGIGSKKDVVDGIVRKEMCSACNGDGCIIIDARTGKQLPDT